MRYVAGCELFVNHRDYSKSNLRVNVTEAENSGISIVKEKYEKYPI